MSGENKKHTSFLVEDDGQSDDFDKMENTGLLIKEDSVGLLNFESIARYRCRQINITKVLDDTTFSSDIKTQYLLSATKTASKCFHVQLEDYIYNIDPKAMEIVFEVVKPVEFIRNNIKFLQNEKAEVTDVLNIKELNQNWENFKQDKLPKSEFFKKLKEQSAEAAEDFIKTGNNEFSKVSVLNEILNKNLFYHILLKVNLKDRLKDFSFTQFSQLFPHLELTTHVTKTKFSEDANTTVFKLLGTLQRDNLSEDDLRKQYDEIYKPMIKFAFTEFDYIYRITYTSDTKTGILLDATASLSERIKNNFETITQFQIKKVEL